MGIRATVFPYMIIHVNKSSMFFEDKLPCVISEPRVKCCSHPTSTYVRHAVLLIVGSKDCESLQWYNVHSNFNDNLPSCSQVETCGYTDRNGQTYILLFHIVQRTHNKISKQWKVACELSVCLL
jgi:hypothetical protein